MRGYKHILTLIVLGLMAVATRFLIHHDTGITQNLFMLTYAAVRRLVALIVNITPPPSKPPAPMWPFVPASDALAMGTVLVISSIEYAATLLRCLRPFRPARKPGLPSPVQEP